ncbi:MAG: hypothetical protein HOV79_34740 [Hamadaea sp.]|nr:hypothetical protein [Hamadaea sp.]
MSLLRRSALAAVAVALAALGGCARPTPGPGAEATAVVGEPGGAVVTVRQLNGDLEHFRLDGAGHVTARSVPAPGAPKYEDCAGTTCYRVGPGLRVTSSAGDVWEITGADYDGLVADYGGMRPASTAVVVRTLPSGHVVFVANGRDGVLYRNEAGQWHRLGLPRGGEGLYWAEPPRLRSAPDPVDPGPIVASAIALMVLALGVPLLLWRRAARTWRLPAVVIAAAAAGAMGWAATYAPGAGMFPAAFVIIGLATVILIAGLGAVAALVPWSSPRPTAPSR